MASVTVTNHDGLAAITLSRGKVNALNERLVEQLGDCFAELEKAPACQAVILTGEGKFFSFGFDIPEFLSYSKGEFTRYLTKFTALYRRIFIFPKPVVAALNGHAVAGACMLATACDHRILVEGKARISLNEIGFGSSVFAGSVEMLKFCVGEKRAQQVLYSGALYSAAEALELGLIDQVASGENLMEEAFKVARALGRKQQPAFGSIKGLMRRPVAEEMDRREGESIREFVDIWYSEPTWRRLQEIKIQK